MSWRLGLSDRAAVLASYEEGVRALEGLAGRVRRWDLPTPCGDWRAVDLAGHALCVVRYYLRLLDAAEAGHPVTSLPRGDELAAMNADDLAHLPEAYGADRTAKFGELAATHLRRLQRADWTIALGTWSGLGEMTVGEHSGVALGEWHVHAWDMARAIGEHHRPSDPLVVARGQAVVFRATEPGDPWLAVLRGYGRDPSWPGQ